MRAAFLALLLVNLMYLAWAEWIDVRVPPANAIAGLPRLKLAVPASRAMASEAGVSDGLGAADGAPTQAASVSQPAAAALAAQCVSVGPFATPADASQALQLLGGQTLSPRQRVAHSNPTPWYWVYLPGPSRSSRMKQVLRRLKAAGIDGAQSMSAPGNPSGKQRISLGLFQDQKLAVRQEHLAQRKGFHPMLAERLVSGPAYWLDLWVPGGAQVLLLKTLSSEAGSAIRTESCPAGESAPQNAPQAVSPGLPAPQAKVSASSQGP